VTAVELNAVVGSRVIGSVNIDVLLCVGVQ